MSAACRYYLGYSGKSIFDRSKDGFAALHHPDGTLIDTGDRVIVPHLADSLGAIAEDGARVFYEGDIAAAIAAHCQDGGTWQFQHDLRYADLYANTTIPRLPTANEAHFKKLPEFLQKSEARRRWTLRFATPQMYQESVKDYYRLLTGVDDTVGKIVAKLREKKLADNTVIIFTSDNGFYLGDYGLAGKWYMHEQSIRLPLISRPGLG